jgi:hypothetical protein
VRAAASARCRASQAYPLLADRKRGSLRGPASGRPESE